MQMTTHIHNNTQILVLTGRFDAHDIKVFDQWMTANLSRETAQVIVNLAEVIFIDSTALSSLVTNMKRCRQMGGDLRICALQPTVRVIFELTRLDKAINLFNSEEEAISSFKQ